MQETNNKQQELRNKSSRFNFGRSLRVLYGFAPFCNHLHNNAGLLLIVIEAQIS